MIGQPDYARELVTRHPDLPLRYSPLPKMIELEPEEIIDPTDVKQCQTLVGELLWLSTRTRPDLSFAVAYLGARVTKSPKGVLELARHVVGYLAATQIWCWNMDLVHQSLIDMVVNSRWLGWTY